MLRHIDPNKRIMSTRTIAFGSCSIMSLKRRAKVIWVWPNRRGCYFAVGFDPPDLTLYSCGDYYTHRQPESAPHTLSHNHNRLSTHEELPDREMSSCTEANVSSDGIADNVASIAGFASPLDQIVQSAHHHRRASPIFVGCPSTAS